jgi:uncharacterized protein DUF4430
MQRRHTLNAAVALAGTCALALGPIAAAGASGTSVSVRIEGKSRTLQAAKTISAPTGTVSQGGHSCSADSGAGLLNAVTDGKWSGTWSKSYKDFEVTKIDGETDSYSTTKSYWEIFVNDVPATTGICGVKLAAGDQILFAAVANSETPGDPLAIEVPKTVTKGKSFAPKVVFFNAKGRAAPLAGVTVSFEGHNYTTGTAGTTPKVSARATGTFTLTAAKKGYIRAEATTTAS